MRTFLIIFCLTLLPIAAVHSAPNLLTNGSFAGGMTDWPWMEGMSAAAPPVEVDRAVFRGADMASLTIRAQQGKRGLLLQNGALCDPATRNYSFRGYWRCRDLGPDWIIRVGITASKGKTVTKWLQNLHLSHPATADWTPFRLDFTVPDDVNELSAFIGLWYAEDLVANPPPGGGQLWFEDVSLEPVLKVAAAPAAKLKQEGVVIDGLFPGGERGVFTPGQPVQLMLVGNNYDGTPAEFDLTLKIKDFEDQPASEKTVPVRLEAGKPFAIPVDLAAPARRGFFCVSGGLQRAGKLVTPLETSFCVIEPVKAQDPFFFADVNGAESELVAAMRLIGVSGRKIGLVFPNMPAEYRGRELQWWQQQLTTGSQAPYWNSDLLLIGNIYLGFFVPRDMLDKVAERRRLGLFPYPDEVFKLFGDFVEAQATAMKGRAKIWVLSEEIDGTIGIPDLQSGSQHAELMRYILASRIAYERIKKVDPENIVVGLAVSGDFNPVPRYQLVRRLLPDLKEYTDVIGPDLYTDPWNWLKEISRGPEAGEMRQKLLDTIALQKSLGKRPQTSVSERGYSQPYHLAPDHPIEKLYAQLNSRSLIIAKSVPGVLFYAHHMMCSGAGNRVREGATSTDENPLLDMAMWKAIPDHTRKFWYRPRTAVAAWATVARTLAGSTDCTEVLPQAGLYTYVFKCPDRSVAVLWTTDSKPCEMRLALPQAVDCSDLMGNTRKLDKGGTALTLTGSPIFLISASSPDALAETLRRANLPGRMAVKAAARLPALDRVTVDLVNQSAQPQEATVQVQSLAGATPLESTLRIALPPSGKIKLEIPLKNVQVDRLGQFQATLKVGDQSAAFVADLSATPIPPAPQVKVDGDLSEWSKLSPLTLDGPEWLLPTRDAARRGEWAGPQDLSARVNLAWDEKYLYLAARVRDDVHLQTQSDDKIWMNDCLQLALDTLNDALPQDLTAPGYDANDYNLAVALTPNGPQAYTFVERGSSANAGPRTFPLAIKRQGDETCYELAVPWELLRPAQPTAGKTLAFSFALFDVDKPEDKQASYWLGLTPGIANGQDPSAYRTFILTK